MKQIHFYALQGDILPVLEAVERDGPLKYVLFDNSTRPDFPTFSRGADIPNLGKADWETGSTSKTFVVGSTATPMRVTKIMGDDGKPRYCMDQLSNPDTVTFTPAGMWGDDVVLSGRVATASDSPISQALMKRFNSAFNKRFTKVKAYRVGPEALALLKAGKRLTISARSPSEFDLTMAPES
jgi:hypothetical protein